MNRKLTYVAIAVILTAAAATTITVTFAGVPRSAPLIVAQLENEGWAVQQVAVHNGEIGISAHKAGQDRDLKIDSASGLILKDTLEDY